MHDIVLWYYIIGTGLDSQVQTQLQLTTESHIGDPGMTYVIHVTKVSKLLGEELFVCKRLTI